MTTTEQRILMQIFDEDFVPLSKFSTRDKGQLREMWSRGEVHYDESRKLFSISVAGVNALAAATAPENPSPAGTIILTIEPAKNVRAA